MPYLDVRLLTLPKCLWPIQFAKVLDVEDAGATAVVLDNFVIRALGIAANNVTIASCSSQAAMVGQREKLNQSIKASASSRFYRAIRLRGHYP